MLRLLYLALLAVLAILPRPSRGAVNVHIVAHSHQDSGWLKTVDQYYAGANNSVQHAGVQFIQKSVIASLMEASERRFVFAEMSFFWRFWKNQPIAMRQRVIELLGAGRISFINGGWVQHDEATCHYQGMVDQTTLGHQFLARTFGASAIPTVTWQIDPFGHSATQASLLGGFAGYDALFFGRIDYADREKRIKEKSLEMVWRSSPSLGRDAQIFAGAFPVGYGPPAGMCFDVLCADDPVMDDPSLEGYDAPARAAAFVQGALEQAAYTRGSHIMLTMGSDFCYEQADEWFHSLDRLIALANADGRVKVFYSTPAAYVAAKHAEKIDWGQPKTDDFFPYADTPHSYWTGYFTSRPALKRLERTAGGFLQAARQLQLLAASTTAAAAASLATAAHKGGADDASKSSFRSSAAEIPGLLRLERAHALVQHHDGVSGTSKQHVAYDYAKRLAAGVSEAAEVAGAALSTLLGLKGAGGGATVSHLIWCPLLNESRCDATEQVGGNGGGTASSVVLVAYNPLADERTEVLIVPVGGSVAVSGADGAPVDSQMLRLPGASPRYAVVFETALKPLGASTYRIVAQPATVEAPAAFVSRRNAAGAAGPKAEAAIAGESFAEATPEFSIENEWLKLTFSGETGRLTGAWRTFEDGSSAFVSLDQGFQFYESFDRERHNIPANGQTKSGTSLPARDGRGYLRHSELRERLDDPRPQNGGAYIFRPATGTPVAIGQDVDGAADGAAASWEVVKGPLVSEVRQIFSPWCEQIVRLRKGALYAELEWSVGPIPVEDGVGKEVVSRLHSAIASERTWWTDSNGREFMKRVRDQRDTWRLNVSEPVAGNFYPVVAGAFIRDAAEGAARPLQLTMLTDRAQGVASLNDGELEFMVHRRLLADDDRGVGEPLNETAGGIGPWPAWERKGSGLVVRGTHLLHLGDVASALREVRPLMDRAYSPVVTAFAAEGDVALAAAGAGGADAAGSYAGLARALPANVHLMTLKLLNAAGAAVYSGGRSEALGPIDSSACACQNAAAAAAASAPTYALLRLAHRFAVGEDPQLSAPVEVALEDFVPGMHLAGAVELALTAARPLAASRRVWRTQGATEDGGEAADDVREVKGTLRQSSGEVAGEPAWSVVLGPMEIGTVLLTLCRTNCRGASFEDSFAVDVGRQ